MVTNLLPFGKLKNYAKCQCGSQIIVQNVGSIHPISSTCIWGLPSIKPWQPLDVVHKVYLMLPYYLQLPMVGKLPLHTNPNGKIHTHLGFVPVTDKKRINIVAAYGSMLIVYTYPYTYKYIRCDRLHTHIITSFSKTEEIELPYYVRMPHRIVTERTLCALLSECDALPLRLDLESPTLVELVPELSSERLQRMHKHMPCSITDIVTHTRLHSEVTMIHPSVCPYANGQQEHQ